MYLLDTNVIAELRRPRPHGAVIAWPSPIADSDLWAKRTHRGSNTLQEDAMIAATARPHALTVVTRNVSDFAGFGVGVFNPVDRQQA